MHDESLQQAFRVILRGGLAGVRSDGWQGSSRHLRLLWGPGRRLASQALCHAPERLRLETQAREPRGSLLITDAANKNLRNLYGDHSEQADWTKT